MPAAHSLRASCGPRPNIEVSIGTCYAVQYLNLEGTAHARLLAQLNGGYSAHFAKRLLDS